jgi:hypothetical protein
MNPFDRQTNADQHHIWQRLIAADSEAFASGDWSMIESDFDSEAFEGVRCAHSPNPDHWKITFPNLASYRDSWLSASMQFCSMKFAEYSPLEALLARGHLNEIEINGDRALAHKKFYGELLLDDGSLLADKRQTLYRLRRHEGVWKIVGFFGQLPLGLA